MVRVLTAAVLLTGCDEVGLDPLLAGQLGPILEVEPAGDITFGGTAITGSGGTETLLLLSTGDEDLVILGIKFDEDTPPAFEMNGDLPLPLSLPPGKEFPISLHFMPEELGGHSGWVVVTVEGDGEIRDLTRRLVGQGCDPEYAEGDCT
ncbi:MAG: hypothetical protein ACI8RZ_000257 [Myxococcota bacterium]|jgi:hypothetical protein